MKLGLSMIVKNEEAGIRRCLESIKPFISYWVIADTGSTDRTKEVIRETMQGTPGEIVDVVWDGWGPTRTIPLELCRLHVDYVIGLLDADEVLEVKDPRVFETMSHDGYHIWRSMGDIEWPRMSIMASRVPWRFEGQLHEIHVGGSNDLHVLEGVSIKNYGKVKVEDPVAEVERYRREADAFALELEKDPSNTRAAFYLAQSYRDSLQTSRAVESYLARAAMPGGFQEERYCALVEAACLMIHPLGWEREKWQPVFLQAYEMRPERAEALFWLGRNLRMQLMFVGAEFFLRQAAKIPRPPSDHLFIQGKVYRWWAKDELAITLCRLGKFDESAVLLRELIAMEIPGEVERQRSALADCENGIRARGSKVALRDRAIQAALQGAGGEERAAAVVDALLAAGVLTEATAAPAAPPALAPPHGLWLNLGCGNKLMAGHRNVDKVQPANEIVDLALPWPWEDGSVEKIVAKNVLQYLPDTILAMNDAYRVLRPGGTMVIEIPSAEATVADPRARMHLNAASFDYYIRGNDRHTEHAPLYGITAEFVEMARREMEDGGLSLTLEKPPL